MLLQMTMFHYFLWLNNILVHTHTYTHTTFSLSIHRHVGCFHVLAIINSPAMNMVGRGQCIYLSELVFSFSLDKYIPRSGIARS